MDSRIMIPTKASPLQWTWTWRMSPYWMSHQPRAFVIRFLNSVLLLSPSHLCYHLYWRCQRDRGCNSVYVSKKKTPSLLPLQWFWSRLDHFVQIRLLLVVISSVYATLIWLFTSAHLWSSEQMLLEKMSSSMVWGHSNAIAIYLVTRFGILVWCFVRTT